MTVYTTSMYASSLGSRPRYLAQRLITGTHEPRACSNSRRRDDIRVLLTAGIPRETFVMMIHSLVKRVVLFFFTSAFALSKEHNSNIHPRTTAIVGLDIGILFFFSASRTFRQVFA
ncbi:hypothetical protein DFJ58DRAFT_505766 [Suillus subalutaceus]|uniref:uncharacterized protein n=1 Tax=Suillus subalutaceus TaxID=48586 RepID=UPI001B871669|nr:uncharacterized protein DFJ58DRAFT_505766 [Suillus subalutaceus]KAG1845696.1 hypothetical protein DFJ58DRAFT_505766 [Suillus subalutaceus]